MNDYIKIPGGLTDERLYQIHRPAAEGGDTDMGTHLWQTSSQDVPAG